jgi:hypothetical protein
MAGIVPLSSILKGIRNHISVAVYAFTYSCTASKLGVAMTGSASTHQPVIVLPEMSRRYEKVSKLLLGSCSWLLDPGVAF